MKSPCVEVRQLQSKQDEPYDTAHPQSQIRLGGPIKSCTLFTCPKSLDSPRQWQMTVSRAWLMASQGKQVWRDNEDSHFPLSPALVSVLSVWQDYKRPVGLSVLLFYLWSSVAQLWCVIQKKKKKTTGQLDLISCSQLYVDFTHKS